MRFKQHQIGLGILITAAVIFCIGNEYYRYQHNRLIALAKKVSAQSFITTVTPEDRAPLAISAETKKKGRIFKIPILMYHHVGTPPANADAVSRGLTVSSGDFETQIKWLKEGGYNSISLNDIYLYSLGKILLPKNPVIFTFDDGYDDVFINAVPILKKYNFTGNFGIITQFPGTTSGTNTYAGWDAIKLAANEGMEIVCHTQNHFDGLSPKFDAAYIFQNLSGCQKDLNDHLGLTMPILIYPYGHYNSTYLEQSRKAGFVMGVTVREGNVINLDDLMQLPRIRIHSSQDFEKFKEQILK